MTDEALLKLALQALKDTEARAVLGDALEEAGWNDRRAVVLAFEGEPAKGTGYHFRAEALAKFGAGVRAIVAALMFGVWPSRWPLAEDNARHVEICDEVPEATQTGSEEHDG